MKRLFLISFSLLMFSTQIFAADGTMVSSSSPSPSKIYPQKIIDRPLTLPKNMLETTIETFNQTTTFEDPFFSDWYWSSNVGLYLKYGLLESLQVAAWLPLMSHYQNKLTSTYEQESSYSRTEFFEGSSSVSLRYEFLSQPNLKIAVAGNYVFPEKLVESDNTLILSWFSKYVVTPWMSISLQTSYADLGDFVASDYTYQQRKSFSMAPGISFQLADSVLVWLSRSHTWLTHKTANKTHEYGQGFVEAVYSPSRNTDITLNSRIWDEDGSDEFGVLNLSVNLSFRI